MREMVELEEEGRLASMRLGAISVLLISLNTVALFQISLNIALFQTPTAGCINSQLCAHHHVQGSNVDIVSVQGCE